MSEDDYKKACSAKTDNLEGLSKELFDKYEVFFKQKIGASEVVTSEHTLNKHIYEATNPLSKAVLKHTIKLELKGKSIDVSVDTKLSTIKSKMMLKIETKQAAKNIKSIVNNIMKGK